MFRWVRRAWATLMAMFRLRPEPQDGDDAAAVTEPRPPRPPGGRTSAIAMDEPREVRQVAAIGRHR